MKRKNLRLKAIDAVAICTLAVLALGCDATEQEQEIQATIDQGVSGLEHGDVKQIFKMTTKDLVALPGTLDRNAMIGRLHFLLRNQGAISVYHPAPEIDVDDLGESALVSAPFFLTRTGAPMPDYDALYENPEQWAAHASEQFEVQNIEVSMVKQEGRWLVSTVRIF